jgi:hypothetical protein
VQDPAQLRIRAVLDDLTHECEAEPAAAVLGQHVHVREVHERDPVCERTRETDLPFAVVGPHHALRVAHKPLNDFVRTPLGPVRLVRQVVVNRRDVDPVRVVVELDGHGCNPRRNG